MVVESPTANACPVWGYAIVPPVAKWFTHPRADHEDLLSHQARRHCPPAGPGAVSSASLTGSATPPRCETPWRLADWAGEFFQTLAGVAKDRLTLVAVSEGDWARSRLAVQDRRRGSCAAPVDVLAATPLISPPPWAPGRRMPCPSRSPERLRFCVVANGFRCALSMAVILPRRKMAST
jgi:hypothetical protein